MSSQQLIRLGGLAAMLAGGLRTAASFSSSAEPGVTLEILYLVIDILLLFGIFGIYAFQHEHIRWFGFVGFLLAVIGTAIIAGPDGTIGVVDMYTAGSLSVGAGIVFLAVGSWAARTLPHWVAILWIVSTVVGILGAVTGRESLFVVTGVTFGLAFVGAGARLWSRTPVGNWRSSRSTTTGTA